MQKNRRRHTRADRGFTLLEIMIVLALIGLIAGAVGTQLYRRFLEGQIRTTRLQVRNTVGDVQQSMIEDSNCHTIEQLVADQTLRTIPKDAWGTPLVLRCPSDHGRDPVDVVSAGPDKKLETKDDINSWEQ